MVCSILLKHPLVLFLSKEGNTAGYRIRVCEKMIQIPFRLFLKAAMLKCSTERLGYKSYLSTISTSPANSNVPHLVCALGTFFNSQLVQLLGV